MNEQAIENLKNGMADRVAKHYDPILKVQMTMKMAGILAADKVSPEIKERVADIAEWSNNIFSTGNIACNLNVILQNQNLALLMENENLKSEIKKLKDELEWQR